MPGWEARAGGAAGAFAIVWRQPRALNGHTLPPRSADLQAGISSQGGYSMISEVQAPGPGSRTINHRAVDVRLSLHAAAGGGGFIENQRTWLFGKRKQVFMRRF